MWENVCIAPAWESYHFFLNNVKQSFLHQMVYYLLTLIQKEYAYIKLSMFYCNELRVFSTCKVRLNVICQQETDEV